MVEASRRTVVGLALAVAFIVSGHGFAKFHRTLNQCLGIQAISKNRFFEVVKLIYPYIHDILSEMCDEEKAQMKRMDSNVLGSWQCAVVTSDGVWHTRGHFSKNGSFIIKNYLTGGLLWFGHKCMRGNSEDDDLFLGTANQYGEISCEGKAYSTKSVLKYEFHQLAYPTEYELQANDAEAVIHPELGRGQSNNLLII